MKRYDLRHLGNDFEARLREICDELPCGEVAIFLFEVRAFDNVEKATHCALESGLSLVNSLRFNEVDWTLVVKRGNQ